MIHINIYQSFYDIGIFRVLIYISWHFSHDALCIVLHIVVGITSDALTIIICFNTKLKCHL